MRPHREQRVLLRPHRHSQPLVLKLTFALSCQRGSNSPTVCVFQSAPVCVSVCVCLDSRCAPLSSPIIDRQQGVFISRHAPSSSFWQVLLGNPVFFFPLSGTASQPAFLERAPALTLLGDSELLTPFFCLAKQAPPLRHSPLICDFFAPGVYRKTQN